MSSVPTEAIPLSVSLTPSEKAESDRMGQDIEKAWLESIQNHLNNRQRGACQ